MHVWLELSEDESPYAAINLTLESWQNCSSGEKLVNAKLLGNDSFSPCLKSTRWSSKFPALGLVNSGILVAREDKGPIWFNLSCLFF